MSRLLPWLCAVVLIVIGCSSPAFDTTSAPMSVPTALSESIERGLTPVPTSVATAAPTAPPATATTAPFPTPTFQPTETPNPFGSKVTALPPAPQGLDGLISDDVAPQPVGLRIDRLDIEAATVIDVGVNADQTFEVPPADEVGWYRFGPSPGQAGSAVLAAHIAFDGVDGVFRHLEDLQPGDQVEVLYNDGSSAAFLIESVTEYDKQGLPDELFAKDGPSKLALITCGGEFNRQLRSYESNTVAVAIPLFDQT